jgi:hypothetical protein
MIWPHSFEVLKIKQAPSFECAAKLRWPYLIASLIGFYLLDRAYKDGAKRFGVDYST